MDWLLENFQALLPVALVLLYLFQRMFVREEGEGGPVPRDSEIQEEARRIQEEIRRKIVARQQGRTPVEDAPDWQEQPDEPLVAYGEPPAPPRPIAFPRHQPEGRSFQDQPTTPFSPPVPPPVPREELFGTTPVRRDLQDELRVETERLREAREAKAEAVRRSSARGLREGAATAGAAPVRTGSLRGRLLADLSTGDSMKRAFLLKEIVDRPIGLRNRPDIFSNWS